MVKESNIYLRIRVEGLESYLKAFPNDKKEKESDPDYKGNGVMVWLNEMKPQQEMVEPAPVMATRPMVEPRPVVEVVKAFPARRF